MDPTRRYVKHTTTTTVNRVHPSEVDAIPEEVLDEFVCDRGETFLSAPKLMGHFQGISVKEGAKQVAGRVNLFQVALDTTTGKKKRHSFRDCPLVWDTGASFGLTPFRGDFIDYVECSIPVNDIARTNIVCGIGTTLHKFRINGEVIFIPCLSYHLPEADVRLFSPQTYHTIYGGHSAVFGQRVEMFIDNLKIGIDIDGSGSNVPMVYDCACSHEEIKTHGPHIRSALPAYERKVDFLGGWSAKHYVEWQLATTAVGDEFEHYFHPSVGVDSNVN